MTKQIINIGLSANDKSGDPLRVAFDKVNQNFTELYLTTGADAAANELVNGVHVVSLGADGILTLPFNNYLETINTNLQVGSQGVVTIRSDAASNLTTKAWTFDKSGTITTPLMLPLTFTAVLDSEHMTRSVGLIDALWEFGIQFQVNPDGTVQTVIDNPAWPSNPGYITGDEFVYVEADHGIPGYTFTLTLTDIQHPGEFIYTTNLAVSEPPTYPSTLLSSGAVKLTANDQDFVLGTDGSITLPAGGTIGNEVGVSGGLSYTFNQDAYGSLNVNAPFIALYQGTAHSSEIQAGWVIHTNAGGQTWTIDNVVHNGTNYELHFSADDSVIHTQLDAFPLTIQSPDYGLNTVTTLTISPDTLVNWSFDAEGKLTLPVGGDIVNSNNVSVLTPTVLDGGNASTTF